MSDTPFHDDAWIDAFKEALRVGVYRMFAKHLSKLHLDWFEVDYAKGSSVRRSQFFSGPVATLVTKEFDAKGQGDGSARTLMTWYIAVVAERHGTTDPHELAKALVETYEADCRFGDPVKERVSHGHP